MKGKSAYISGLASYIPKKILTNQDLEKMVDTTDEWIFSRTGIQERRVADQDQFTSDMGYEAAKLALKRAKKRVEQIDLILVATLSPDYLFPSTACIIQGRLGANKSAAFDIQAACSGLLYAFSHCKSFHRIRCV